MRKLVAFLLMMVCLPVMAAEVPVRAKTYAPMLAAAQEKLWADAPEPWTLAGLVEQETCPSLTHKKCWNPLTELKTSREHGIGFGQTTKAYNSDGSVRFDKLTELSQTYSSLKGWSWKNWQEPSYQLTAIVEMNHSIYKRVRDAASPDDYWAFTLSAYNGGESGVRQDRLLCSNTRGCDSRVWFRNVERHSLKARKPNKGYGQSAYDINRGYVDNVINIRRTKYELYFRGSDGN